MNLPLEKVQKYLTENAIDSWVVYQFMNINPLFNKIIEDPEAVVTRRAMLVIPKLGEPILLHSQVDGGLTKMGLKTMDYRSYDEFKQKLGELLKGSKKVAMEYSPNSQIPHISKVDAGIVDVVRALGMDVVSSGDLMQLILQLSDKDIESHKKACKLLDEIRRDTFKFIEDKIKAGQVIDEYQIQQFIASETEKRGAESYGFADAVINENAAISHYAPSKENSKPLKVGDLLLIDMWLKLKGSEEIYSDITWMAFRGKKVPQKIQDVVLAVFGGRDAAVEFLRQKVKDGKEVEGWEVDKVARDYITQKGFGQYFTHRLGHSIGTFVHGDLTHLDNYENKDYRKILNNHISSIEPGVYIPGEFGVRSELDILVKDGEVIVTTEKQTEIYLLPE